MYTKRPSIAATAFVFLLLTQACSPTEQLENQNIVLPNNACEYLGETPPPYAEIFDLLLKSVQHIKNIQPSISIHIGEMTESGRQSWWMVGFTADEESQVKNDVLVTTHVSAHPSKNECKAPYYPNYQSPQIVILQARIPTGEHDDKGNQVVNNMYWTLPAKPALEVAEKYSEQNGEFIPIEEILKDLGE